MSLSRWQSKATWPTLPLRQQAIPVAQSAQPLRLAVITQFFPPDYAATGQLVDELVRHIGHQNVVVDVFTGQPGYAFQTPSAEAEERSGNVTIRRSQVARLWPKRIRGKAVNGVLFCIRAAVHLMRVCRQNDVLLITTAPPFVPVLGYLAHALFGLPYICLLYDLYPDIANELGVIAPTHWLSRLWNQLNCRVWQRAQGVVVLSSTMKDRVVAKCPAIAPKISIIHNWADPDWIVPLKKQENWFAWKHQLVNTFTVLYSGNLGRCHDVQTLLDAIQYLRHDPIQFAIIGSGVKHTLLKEEVDRLGLSNVRFFPYQEKQDLPYSLTACDLTLVSVEQGMEGLVAPSKLYSALAAGRPIGVICEDQSYLRQIITDARCGAAFQNGDAKGLADFIRMVQSDRPLAERMGASGRAYLQEHFTPTHIAHQYTALLRQTALHAHTSQG